MMKTLFLLLGGQKPFWSPVRVFSRIQHPPIILFFSLVEFCVPFRNPAPHLRDSVPWRRPGLPTPVFSSCTDGPHFAHFTASATLRLSFFPLSFTSLLPLLTTAPEIAVLGSASASSVESCCAHRCERFPFLFGLSPFPSSNPLFPVAFTTCGTTTALFYFPMINELPSQRFRP